jgi:hypothetical protein
MPSERTRFNLVLPLYWPKESFLAGEWKLLAVTLSP